MPGQTIVHQASITIQDGKGKKSTVGFYVRGAWDPTDTGEAILEAFDFAREMCVAIAPLIHGRITGVSVTPGLSVPAGAVNPVEVDADVEEGVTLSLKTADQTYVTLRIPTINEDLLDANGNLDMANADVTYLKEMLTAPEELAADWAVYVTDNRGAAVKSLVSARESFTRSRA